MSIEGKVLKIEQASSIFNQIITKCPELNGKSFVIMYTQEIPLSNVGEGYEIAVRINEKEIEEKTILTLQKLVEKENLKVEKRKTAILIYTPKPFG